MNETILIMLIGPMIQVNVKFTSSQKGEAIYGATRMNLVCLFTLELESTYDVHCHGGDGLIEEIFNAYKL